MQQFISSYQRLPRDLQLNAWAWGCLAFGYFGIFSVLYNLYLVRLGIDAATIGLLTGFSQLVWALSAIPAGMIGHRIGNREATMWGFLVTGAAVAVLLLMQFVAGGMLIPWIAFWWSVAWIGSALFTVNGAPWVMSVASPGQSGVAFTWQFLFAGIGGFAGSLLAGALPGFFASLTNSSMESAIVYWYPLWLAPLAYAGGWLLFSKTKPTKIHRDDSSITLRLKAPYAIIVFMTVVTFLGTMGEGVVRTFFNIYLDTDFAVPVLQIGIVMGLGQVLPIFANLVTPLVLQRWGSERGTILVNLGNALCLLLMAAVASWLAASAGYLGFMMIVPVASVVRTLFSQEIIVARWRTMMSIGFTVGNAMGLASASGIGGYLIATLGFGALFFWGSLASALSGLLVWGYLRVGPREQPDKEETAVAP